MTWELREVDDVECVLDDSGLYVVINRFETERTFKDMADTVITVRADLMTADHEPLMSWQGSANAVRKALARYLEEYHGINHPSMEHMSYIGYELLRAEITPHYEQD